MKIVPLTGLSQTSSYSVSVRGKRSDNTFTEWSKFYNFTTISDTHAPDTPTGLAASWEGSGTLVITWNALSPKPADFKDYKLSITGNGHTEIAYTNSLSVNISMSQINALFGGASSFSISLSSRDINLNESVSSTISINSPSLGTAKPAITVIGQFDGYSVNIDKTSMPSIGNLIQILEYSSSSGGTGTVVWTGDSTTANIVKYNEPGTYYVTARYTDLWQHAGDETSPRTEVVTLDISSVLNPDITPPTNPTGFTATGMIDENDKSGFSVIAYFTWTASTDTTTKGYNIRWSLDNPASVTYPSWEYASTDSTVTKYTVPGLIPNVTYYYQIASVDQLGNTQTYSDTQTLIVTDSLATAEGSFARLRSFLSIGGAAGELFKFGTGINTSINTSPTSTPSLNSGTYHGIILNRSDTSIGNNYWTTDGHLRVGTNTDFMFFNGHNLYVSGDINAKSGYFSGNVQITQGSLWAGQSANSGQRVAIKSDGIIAYDASSEPSTYIHSTASSGDPTFTTTRAIIGGWDVTSTKIYKNGVTLDSSNPSITVNSGSNYVGMIPGTGTDIILWAGAYGVSTRASSPFKVDASGKLVASNAEILGKVEAKEGRIGVDISGNGGWNITSNLISSGTSPTYAAMSSSGTYAFYAGNSTAASAPFRIGFDGSLYSSNITVEIEKRTSGTAVSKFKVGSDFMVFDDGSVIAKSIDIGNQSVTAGDGQVVIKKSLTIGSGSSDTIYFGENITFNGTPGSGSGATSGWSGIILDNATDKGYNYWLKAGTDDYRFQVGNATNFMKWNGTLLEINGKVTANTGYIGGATGWEITTNTITGNSSSVITGGSFVGNTIKTAGSGTRIEINSQINSASIYLWDHTLDNSGSITIYDSYGANALRIMAPWTDSTYMPMLSLSGNDGSMTYEINNDPVFLMDKTSINLYKDTAVYGTIYSTDSGGVTGQKRLRNIYINQGATPTGGLMGDVWLVY